MADGPALDASGNGDQQSIVVLADRDAWRQEAFESKRFAAACAVERQALADALATAEARAKRQAASAIEAALRERDGAVALRDAAIAERDQALAAAHDARAMLHRVTSSTAWRLTAPVRVALMTLMGRNRGSDA